jgi:hypothetical protein
MSHDVVLHLEHSRVEGGDDVGRLLRQGLGEHASIEAVLDDAGAVSGYKINMRFPTPEVAFDAAVALRNWLAAEGLGCVIE